MRVVQLVPGSGGTFYCENCLRDAGLVAALRQAGHETLMVPLYLPLPAEGVGTTPDAPNAYRISSIAHVSGVPCR